MPRVRQLLVLCALIGAIGAVACDGLQGNGTVAQVEHLAGADADLAARLKARPEAWTRDGAWLTSTGWQRGTLGSHPDLGARLPDRADGALELGLGRQDAMRLRLAPEGALGVPAVLDRGRVLYRGAYASTDAVVVADERRVEVLFLMHDARAPREFTWRVQLPSDLPEIVATPQGGLAIRDAAGRTRINVPPAFALDAHGTRRDAQLAYADGRLAVRLDTAGLVFPVLLDPAYEIMYWDQKLPYPDVTPPGRETAAMAFDSVRGVTVVFGGNAAGLSNQVWEWNGATWANKTPGSGGPAARAEAMMAFDARAAVQKTILFGGSTGAVQVDVWTWDGATWVQKCTGGACTTAARPAPRRSGGMVYDPTRARVLLFGGCNQACSTAADKYNDLWEFDVTANSGDGGWTLKCSSGACLGSPAAMPPISHFGMANRNGDRTVMFGGVIGGGTEMNMCGARP